MHKFIVVLCLLGVSYAQTRVIGEVTAKSESRLTLKTDAGESVDVPLSADVAVLRVPPGETSLAKAAKIAIDQVGPGDRVLVRPNQIIVMSRTDLQQKQAAERAEWQKRGSAGRIAAIAQDSIDIQAASGQILKVRMGPKTSFRRYAPGSVRFSDARESSFAELKSGDQVRVLGNASGDTVDAEVVVSGAFRNFAGTVISVDEAAGLIRLTDLETKKPVAVKVSADSTLKTLPAMMAQMLAARRSAGSDGSRPQGRDFGQMLERMPPLNIADLKPGDAVIVASTAGSPDDQAGAIAVVAGVEPLLTGPAADRRLSGPWSLDINIAP